MHACYLGSTGKLGGRFEANNLLSDISMFLICKDLHTLSYDLGN